MATTNSETVRNLTTSHTQIIKELQQMNADLRKQKSDKEKQIEIETARKIQSEHDKTEARLKMESTADIYASRDFINKPDVKPQQTLSGIVITNVNASIADPLTPLADLPESARSLTSNRKFADGEVYCIVSSGYYLCWNKSRCYIQHATKNTGVNILVNSSDIKGDFAVMQGIPSTAKVRDLTRAEFDGIVKGKPLWEDLFKIYSRMFNWNNVYLDLTKAVAVW